MLNLIHISHKVSYCLGGSSVLLSRGAQAGTSSVQQRNGM